MNIFKMPDNSVDLQLSSAETSAAYRFLKACYPKTAEKLRTRIEDYGRTEVGDVIGSVKRYLARTA